MTTKDVVFTWEVGGTRKPGFPQELYRRILKIDVQDEKTFTLHLDRVTFEYASIGDFRLLPAHLEREIFEADPADTATAPTSTPIPPIPACISVLIGLPRSLVGPI
ncbi:MAG: hypothetical protein R3F37_15520 [Candidatus Competibacteraceae bacterium]